MNKIIDKLVDKLIIGLAMMHGFALIAYWVAIVDSIPQVVTHLIAGTAITKVGAAALLVLLGFLSGWCQRGFSIQLQAFGAKAEASRTAYSIAIGATAALLLSTALLNIDWDMYSRLAAFLEALPRTYGTGLVWFLVLLWPSWSYYLITKSKKLSDPART